MSTDVENPKTPVALGRLRKRAEFVRLTRRGRRWGTPGLVLQVLPRRGEEPAAIRFGVTASKKVGNAVKRNRAKRRLRALAGAILPDAGRPGCDYVLIARPATVDRPFISLQNDLTTALKRVHEKRHEKRGRHPKS